MCNHYVSPEEAEIERFWEVGRRNPVQWWQPAIFPRSLGPFVRSSADLGRELVVGQWGLIPWFAKTPKLTYSTNNARFEGIEGKASYKHPWMHGKRCIIPAWSFDEPCWETGRNVWWTFRRADGNPWGLAGLWNAWTDADTGEIFESYTMLTINADNHPLMSRMHKPKPKPKLPPDQQDKRSVVAIEFADMDDWLHGSVETAAGLVRVPSLEVIEAAPAK